MRIDAPTGTATWNPNLSVNWSGNKPTHPAGHCQFCGYNLFSLTGNRCPECGNLRAAWVEAPCEECGKTCVFAVEEADRVHACQFCGKSVDVPACKLTAPGAESILKTRFAVFPFIFSVFMFTLLMSPVSGGLMFLAYWIGTHARPPR